MGLPKLQKIVADPGVTNYSGFRESSNALHHKPVIEVVPAEIGKLVIIARVSGDKRRNKWKTGRILIE